MFLPNKPDWPHARPAKTQNFGVESPSDQHSTVTYENLSTMAIEIDPMTSSGPLHHPTEALSDVQLSSTSLLEEETPVYYHRQRLHSFSDQLSAWGDSLDASRIRLIAAILTWYGVGVVAIVTTKILLTEWQVPPLLLTFQQLLISSTLLRIRLFFSKEGVEQWPWKQEEESPIHHLDYCLMGLFNAMDFLASNTAFYSSPASFVETIKSTDPISTTAVALAWKVDRLGRRESQALALLMVGMLLSTVGNAEDDSGEAHQSLLESAQSAATVMTANVCFAFRCLTQKLYRLSSSPQMSDENLQMRMQQIGWLALLPVVLVCYRHLMWDAFFEPTIEENLQYLKIAMANALCYAVYNFAGTYVLSKLTVLHHSTLGCLRRMLCIVATCIFFAVPMTPAGAIGVATSFVGFIAFTIFRSRRRKKEIKTTQ